MVQKARRGRPATGRDTKYQRAKTFKYSHFEVAPSALRHNAKFSNAWYRVYHDPTKTTYNDVAYITDTLKEYAERVDTDEAWQSYREIYNQWTWYA